MSTRPTGFSLIEVLVAMTIGMAMMALATALLYGLLRTERSARDLTQESSIVNALADQFRRDAHATPVGSVSSEDGWQFAPDGGRTVTYRVRAGEVLRVEQVGQSVGRKVFPLPPGMTASIDRPRDAEPAIVRLVIATTPDANRQPLQIDVDAACGLDRRFDAADEPFREETDE